MAFFVERKKNEKQKYRNKSFRTQAVIHRMADRP